VALDRSWVSEGPYGRVVRGGSRLRRPDLARLERLAAAAGGVVVLCRPRLAACLESWRGRRAEEYPREEAQVRAVWREYGRPGLTSLPVVKYDREAASARRPLDLATWLDDELSRAHARRYERRRA
jgi:hypothetical protein